MKITKTELKNMIREVLREELNRALTKKPGQSHSVKEGLSKKLSESLESDIIVDFECEECGHSFSEKFAYDYFEDEADLETVMNTGDMDCPECGGQAIATGYEYTDTNNSESLDVSASEVDDLARDVYADMEFEDAYRADGNTVGEAVEALIVEVISSEYPDIDLGNVPDRVSNALSNMLESGLLG
jgi:hypothetical protein